ncbi:autotransporter outer membrane beta-barrel domain-containing protein [Tropicimonas sp. S265A]|uniref:autotransporter family protein n=1 Tax=Tropicimonas sp. S265A TaxID=3415134 RepID=UPI003C7A4C93
MPGQSTVPGNASVLTLLNVDVAGGSGDFVSREALVTNINGKLRVNVIGTTIGSGRSMTFAPANGGDVDPTEVYFQSDTPLTYSDLTVTNATEIVFGAINIQTRVADPSDFTLTNSSMSATSDMVLAGGSTLRLDGTTTLTTVEFDNFGTLTGTGTVNAFNFNMKAGSTLSPGASIGTLNINSAISFDLGAIILSELDPAAGQKADLIVATDAVSGINNAQIQVDAARPGLTAQDYVAGNDYTVFQASSFDGDMPSVVAGASLPALATPRVANTPSTDGRIDIAFDALPVTALPLLPAVSGSANASSLAGAVATSATQAPGTSLTSGTSLGSALSTLTNAGLAGFNSVHAEPYSSNLTIGLEQLDLITNTVLSHADCRKYQPAGLPDRAQPLASGAIGAVQTGPAAAADGALACAQRRWWVDTAYVNGRVDGRNGLGTFDYTIGTIVAGADLFSFDDSVIGVFAGLGTSSMDEHDQVIQDFSTDSFHAGIYGRTEVGAWEISGLLGYVSGETDAQRSNPSLDGFTGGDAEAELDQDGFHAGLQARTYATLTDGAIVATTFGLTYGRIGQGAAVETGSGDFLYAIDEADADALVGSIGVDYRKDFVTGYGVLTPMAFARYEYDFLANNSKEHEITVTSPIFGTFTQVGQNRGASGLVLGVGLGYALSDRVRFTTGYGYSKRSNGQEHAFGANLSVLF